MCATLAAAFAFAASTATPSELITRQLDEPPTAFPQLARDGPWLRVCEERGEGEDCRYEQTVVASNGDQVILTLLPPGEGAPVPVALFRTPLYALLPPGLTLAFDGSVAGRVGFRACSPRGCLASLPLQGSARSSMARANRVAVEFISQALEPVQADFSLKGSADILKSM